MGLLVIAVLLGNEEGVTLHRDHELGEVAVADDSLELLLGWCIGGTLCLMHGGLYDDSPARNMVLLSTPVDTRRSLYANWVGRDWFDVDYVADEYEAVPGGLIDWAKKMMKPVTNYWTSTARLWENVLNGEIRREAYQTMARWIADNPPFPARAFREWITWMYKENRLVRGRLRLGRRAVDLSRIDQSLLIVTAGADHIAPPGGTHPLLGLVSSQDITRVDRPGGHIGLMAGSGARKGIWPEISAWLRGRSQTTRRESRNGSSSGP